MNFGCSVVLAMKVGELALDNLAANAGYLSLLMHVGSTLKPH